MNNIVSYIKENGHLSFDELPFGEADSLVFATLVYLDYSCCTVQPEPFSVTLGDLRGKGFCTDLPKTDRFPEKCSELFLAASESRRFRDVGVDFFINDIDIDAEKQFAALTFRLSPALHYIAFRGTDGTLAGWKEDFNLSFMEDVPAQRAACAYFETLCRRFGGQWIIGGHSKGGNLSVYAALSAEPQLQKEIPMIFDHDGPGFMESILSRPGFAEIAPRINKTIPESAVVGMLLTDPTECRVVKSTARGILQHDPLTWVVEGDHFQTADTVDVFSRTADHALHQWIGSVGPENLKLFTDTIFDLIHSSGAETTAEVAANWKNDLPAIAEKVRDLPPDVRRAVWETILSLIQASGENILASLGEQMAESGEALRTQRERMMEVLAGIDTVQDTIDWVKSFPPEVRRAVTEGETTLTALEGQLKNNEAVQSLIGRIRELPPEARRAITEGETTLSALEEQLKNSEAVQSLIGRIRELPPEVGQAVAKGENALASLEQQLVNSETVQKVRERLTEAELPTSVARILETVEEVQPSDAAEQLRKGLRNYIRRLLSEGK